MAQERIEDQLKELIVERLFLDLDPEEIEDEVPLSEYGVDSFLLLELVVAMEEIFGVTFDQSDITTESLKSVRSMADLVRMKQSG